jgi:uncharacterized OB-fold protein
MNIAKNWRQRATRYRLEGQRRRSSGEIRFPAVPAALGEDPADWEPVTLSGRGELYSFSVLRQAPEGFESFGIYAVGLVRLAEGPLVTAQLTDCDEDELQIGMPLEMATRRMQDSGADGVLVYGYKFRPLLG